MNRIKAFGAFWCEFIVGDDWRVAVAVVAALAITCGIATTAIPAWWVLPATVAFAQVGQHKQGLTLHIAVARAS